MKRLKEKNFIANLEIIRPNFNETNDFKLEDFIPPYFYDKMCLPSNELNFQDAIKNIDEKIKRDWLYHLSFLEIVNIVSGLGTCARRKVGAVLVKNRRILATGFNGTPPGAPHCNDEICPGKNAPSGSSLALCSAVHAEENALLYCAKYGVSATGATLYVSCEPCDICMKHIETVGIEKVIYIKEYPTKMTALRKYFRAKCYSLANLQEQYTQFSRNRIEFSTILDEFKKCIKL